MPQCRACGTTTPALTHLEYTDALGHHQSTHRCAACAQAVRDNPQNSITTDTGEYTTNNTLHLKDVTEWDDTIRETIITDTFDSADVIYQFEWSVPVTDPDRSPTLIQAVGTTTDQSHLDAFVEEVIAGRRLTEHPQQPRELDAGFYNAPWHHPHAPGLEDMLQQLPDVTSVQPLETPDGGYGPPTYQVMVDEPNKDNVIEAINAYYEGLSITDYGPGLEVTVSIFD